MQPLQLTFHSDPGHGWLEVPKVIVHGLGKQICAAISFYSYQDERNLYLEEDCDAPLIFNELKKTFTITEKCVSYDDEAPIRKFKRVNC